MMHWKSSEVEPVAIGARWEVGFGGALYAGGVGNWKSWVGWSAARLAKRVGEVVGDW